MLGRQQVERAVDLQARGYRLLQWLEKAFDGGFITPEAAHRYASMEDSAHAWIEKHYLNLPELARPVREDMRPFSKLFSTYLVSTFDLEANPGKRFYSPGAHCFCSHCSWMVKVPHLRPKKIGPADRKTAESLRRGFVRGLAVDIGVDPAEEGLERMLRDTDLREPIGMCTYAADLLRRMDGRAIGAASLALWRSFAWTTKGSPKKNFMLSADAIMAAQEVLVASIESHCARRVEDAG